MVRRPYRRGSLYAEHDRLGLKRKEKKQGKKDESGADSVTVCSALKCVE